MNHIILIGHTGKDPEKRESANLTIVTCSLATNDGTKDKPKTNWHNLVVFGKTADIFLSYVRKGSKVCVTGRIDYETYQDKEGVTKYATKVIVDRLELLDNKDGETRQPSQAKPVSESYEFSDNGQDNSDLPF